MTDEAQKYMADLIATHPDVDKRLLERIFEAGYGRGLVEGLERAKRIWSPQLGGLFEKTS